MSVGNPEHAFLGACLELGDAAAVTLADPAWFLDSVARHAWLVICEYVHKHQRMPGMKYVMARAPTLTVQDWGAAPAALAELVRQQWTSSRTDAALEDAAGDDGDPDERVDRAIESLGKIRASRRGDEKHSQKTLLRDAYRRYGRREAGERDPARPWAWAPLQDITGGVPYGSFVIFYGRMKQMKSWLMLYTTLRWWIGGAKLLTILKELSVEQWADRLLLQIAGVDSYRFRDGILTPLERLALQDALELVDSEELPESDALHLSALGRDAALRQAAAVCFLNGRLQFGDGELDDPFALTMTHPVSGKIVSRNQAPFASALVLWDRSWRGLGADDLDAAYGAFGTVFLPYQT